jgi:hypothetical protein
MSYRVKPFEDRKELYLWASEGKPIWCNGLVYTRNEELKYVDVQGIGMSFNCIMSMYKKVIPVEKKVDEFWVNYYSSVESKYGYFKYYYESEKEANVFAGMYKGYIKTEKFSTEIEVNQ